MLRDVYVVFCVVPLQVTQTQLSGTWTASRCREAMELAMGGCSQLKGALREVLISRAAEVQQKVLQEAAAAGGGGLGT
jgi:hypothetical protein